jgi:predicted polyphosphate/ATP-dependent NAD kinase
MTFRYRYVGFGTNFESRLGDRSREDTRGNPKALHENEVALDVGNIC